MMTLISCFYWILASASMTALCAGMMDLGIRKFVHVLLDTGMRQYDGVGDDGLFTGYSLA